MKNILTICVFASFSLSCSWGPERGAQLIDTKLLGRWRNVYESPYPEILTFTDSNYTSIECDRESSARKEGIWYCADSSHVIIFLFKLEYVDTAWESLCYSGLDTILWSKPMLSTREFSLQYSFIGKDSLLVEERLYERLD